MLVTISVVLRLKLKAGVEGAVRGCWYSSEEEVKF